MFSLLDEIDLPHSRIDKKVYDLLFSPYPQRDADGLKGHLDRSDPLEVFKILKEVNKELSSVKLENDILFDFLQKNDPKLLTGLNAVRRQATQRDSQSTDLLRKIHESGGSSPIVGRTESRNTSVVDSLAESTRRSIADFRLNYRTKAEIAEKFSLDLLKICQSIEAKGTHDIKLLTGQIEELRHRCADTKETIKNFEMNFVKNNTLEDATGKQKEKHLRKFVNNWLRNARALLGTMRLKITSLQEQCHQQRTALISKADLSGMLGPVDFEQLQIKRDDQTKCLDEKNISLAELKEVSGKAALALAEEKKVVLAIEQKSKALDEKTIDVANGITKLEMEAKIAEDEVDSAVESLKNLKIQVEEYEAPSVTDYILKKQELIALEKEEKLLQRKSYIQNIKMKNLTMKLRMKNIAAR